LPSSSSERPLWTLALSPGAWVIAGLGLVSSLLVLTRSSDADKADASMWTFAAPHYAIYAPAIESWNRDNEFTVELHQLSRQVMDRRMTGGFLGGVPTADLLEPERSTASLAFSGPVEAVGFLDLTDRLRDEGLLEAINTPSFSPWTYEGRIFGIPHDVHPVMLGYRADLIEAAGIDLSRVETWDDLFEALRPLRSDERYPLSLWDTNSDMIELLLLQAGGGGFTPEGVLAFDRPVNARTIAVMVSWMVGPDRVTADVPEFSPTGNALKREGRALCYLMPDWMCNIWRRELPDMAGKLKLMPLPAWEPGGLRTSIWGGSMLGLSRVAEDHDELWAFAKYLYLSDELARELYRTGDIITPVRSHWDDPIFDEPDPYFSGQPKGRLYIDLADEVPLRTSSPFFTQARQEMQNVVSRLRQWAEQNGVHEPAALEPQAAEYLRDAQASMRRLIDRNAFHRDAGGERSGE
jgi:arabinosaccharide transport system substrate-binding protein